MKTKSTTRSRYGFTLIEILVTIGIIALLAGLLVPGVHLALKAANKSKTMASIRMISGGVKMYANDFDDELPPTDSTARSVYNLDSGAKIICALMTGYADDAGTKGTPGTESTRWTTDDGKEGMGFRIRKRGPVHGPYNGTEVIPMDPPVTSILTDAKVFVDAWDKPILYYRDTGNSSPKFEDGDNDNVNPHPDNSFLTSNYNGVAEEFLILSSGGKSSYSDVEDAVSNIQED